MTTEIAVLTVSLAFIALYALAVTAFRNLKRMNADAFHALGGARGRGRGRLPARRRSFYQRALPDHIAAVWKAER